MAPIQFSFSDLYVQEGKDFHFIGPEEKIRLNTLLYTEPGYVVLKDFPGDVHDAETMKQASLAFAFCLGLPLSQNQKHDFVVHVKDYQEGVVGPKYRGYRTRETLPYHNDRSDIAFLLCLQQAEEGGETTLINATDLHDEVKALSQEAMETLQQPLPYDRRAAELKGEKGWDWIRPFSTIGQKTAVWYCRKFIDECDRFEDCPALTPKQLQALSILDDRLQHSDKVVRVRLAPGDLLLFNNHRVLHSRTHFSGGNRELLRVWVSTEEAPELPLFYQNLFGRLGSGSYRGGVWTNEFNLSHFPEGITEAKSILKDYLSEKNR